MSFYKAYLQTLTSDERFDEDILKEKIKLELETIKLAILEKSANSKSCIYTRGYFNNSNPSFIRDVTEQLKNQFPDCTIIITNDDKHNTADSIRGEGTRECLYKFITVSWIDKDIEQQILDEIERLEAQYSELDSEDAQDEILVKINTLKHRKSNYFGRF